MPTCHLLLPAPLLLTSPPSDNHGNYSHRHAAGTDDATPTAPSRLLLGWWREFGSGRDGSSGSTGRGEGDEVQRLLIVTVAAAVDLDVEAAEDRVSGFAEGMAPRVRRELELGRFGVVGRLVRESGGGDSGNSGGGGGSGGGRDGMAAIGDARWLAARARAGRPWVTFSVTLSPSSGSPVPRLLAVNSDPQTQWRCVVILHEQPTLGRCHLSTTTQSSAQDNASTPAPSATWRWLPTSPHQTGRPMSAALSSANMGWWVREWPHNPTDCAKRHSRESSRVSRVVAALLVAPRAVLGSHSRGADLWPTTGRGDGGWRAATWRCCLPGAAMWRHARRRAVGLTRGFTPHVNSVDLEVTHGRMVEEWRQVWAGGLDHVAGLMVGWLVWAYRGEVEGSCLVVARSCVGWLLQHVNWIMRTPAGVKMHAELSGELARCILFCLGAASRAALMLLSHIKPEEAVRAVASTAAVFGLSGLIAAIHDMSLLCISPVMAVAFAMGNLYQWQLHGILWTWRLIHTPRPFYASGMSPLTPETPPPSSTSTPPTQPSESPTSRTAASTASPLHEAEGLVVERLIVGVLLFIPLLLLLPTTSAYAFFFGCLAITSAAASTFLSILADLVASGWPIVPALLRLCFKDLHTSGIYLEPYPPWRDAVAKLGTVSSGISTSVFRLRSVHSSWGAQVLLPGLRRAVSDSEVALLPGEAFAWLLGRRRFSPSCFASQRWWGVNVADKNK